MNTKLRYVPKGGMCVNCENKKQDCSKLDFENMPVIEVFERGRIVKCLNFQRSTAEK